MEESLQNIKYFWRNLKQGVTLAKFSGQKIFIGVSPGGESMMKVKLITTRIYSMVLQIIVISQQD